MPEEVAPIHYSDCGGQCYQYVGPYNYVCIHCERLCAPCYGNGDEFIDYCDGCFLSLGLGEILDAKEEAAKAGLTATGKPESMKKFND